MPESKIHDIDERRYIDLYIGAATIDGEKVPMFAAHVHHEAYFNAILENLEDLGDDAFTLSLRVDPRTLGDKAAPVIQMTDWRKPTYTARAETIERKEIEWFDENLAALEKAGAKRLTLSIYHFESDKFDGKNIQDFWQAFQKRSRWLMIVEHPSTKRRKVWVNKYVTFNPDPENQTQGRARRRRRTHGFAGI